MIYIEVNLTLLKGMELLSHKKIYFSVTATAVIASAFFATESAEAASYKVKSGDSLWKIAQQHNVSVANLKKINGLTSDLIHPNQVIETSGKVSAPPATENPKPQAPATSARTYTVKRGDNLSQIAATHKISLANLMTWNNLDTTLIFPGNVLVVSQSGSSGSGTVVEKPSTTPSKPAPDAGASKPATGGTVYVVKSGDSLSRIAANHSVSVANLKQWNSLKSDLILIGQKLAVNANGNVAVKPDAPAAPDVAVDYNLTKLISTAKSVMGVPYVWGGQTTSGFDCSGFVHFAYNAAGKSGARTNTGGYYNRSFEVTNPQVGDLVFFSGTYKAGISHLGIYLGNGDFIHAGTSTGVTISNVNDNYWKKHFTSYKRFY